MCNNNLAIHDRKFSQFSILLHNLLLSCTKKRNEIFPQLELGEKQNADNYTKGKKRQIEGIRKWPAGLRVNTTSYVLAANLGPIM